MNASAFLTLEHRKKVIIIKNIRIKRLSKNEIELIYKKQMHKDFPPSEIKPLERIVSLWEKGFYEAFGLYEEEVLLGYAFLSTSFKKQWWLLDYFAIIEHYRSSGYGSTFLSMIKQELNQKAALLIEIESIESAKNQEEKEQRVRRRKFYMANAITPVNHLATIFDTEFEVLVFPFIKEVIKEKVIEEYKLIYKSMLPTSLYEKHCLI